MSNEGYRSYALTIRPLHGIADQTVEALVSWFNKLDYAVAVIEMDNESRHMHAQIWSNQPKRKGDICKALQRICERTIENWDNAQLKVLRMGVKIAYSDWYLDYLTENDAKDDPNIFVYKPPDKSFDFYPTEEEQEAVRQVATSVDPRFTHLEQKFLEWHDDQSGEITKIKIAKFLAICTNEDRTMKVICQKKDRIALCQSLYNYITKSDDPMEWLPQDHEEKKLINNIEKITQTLQLQP